MAKLKVQVWIFHRDEQQAVGCLLLKTTPARGGFWQPVTGGVEAGESLEAAAMREVAEETGWSIDSPICDLDRCFNYQKNGTEFEEHGFALWVDQRKDPRLDPGEHCDWAWVQADQAPHLLGFQSNRDMLQAGLNQKKQ